MSCKYRKISRTPQVGKDAGKKKYYATAVPGDAMTFDEFVTHISTHNSPYSRGTVNGVLMDTLDCLKELVLDGKSVRLGDLGLFSIGITSRGEDTPDKVTAQSIEGIHLIVRNTKNWSNAELAKSCKLELYDSYVIDGDSTPGAGDTPGGNAGGGSGSTGSGGSGGSTGSGGSGSGPGSEEIEM